MESVVPASGRAVTKADIVNRLVSQFGYRSYLEYNKFDGASYYGDVVCEQKELAYLPERAYLDGDNLPRLLGMAQAAVDMGVRFDRLLSLQQLFEHFGERRFDVIFFDPVHVRPDVDLALRALPRLLTPGGVLVVHDCVPGHERQTSVQRCPGSWVGETYKAFALLRRHNMRQTVTVSEDFGVGLVWNHRLCLDYPVEYDLDYATFHANRVAYTGLIDYATFLQRTRSGQLQRLFCEDQPATSLQFQPRQGWGQPEGQVPRPTARCQLFWRHSGAGFSEAESQELPLYHAGQPELMRFVLPPEVASVHALRFDPLDGPGSVRLQSLRLMDQDGVVHWEAEGRATLFERMQGMCCLPAAPGAGVYLMSKGEDPRCVLGIDAVVLAQIRAGWALELRVELQPVAAHAVLGLLGSMLET
ncbi:MAG: hypothetical protein EKK49_00585 [Rhodocyclaceae bacterium]|nr:MAG: hypothetical protein EKK49_00585 [Rhodocyclaceae bacterium]